MSAYVGHAPWFARQSRRAVLLVRWAITGELPDRLRMWWRARRIRRSAPITPELQPMLISEADPARIRVPHSDEPVISIIIPTYGQAEFTLRCLGSIAAHPPRAAIEIIVVDDATQDGSTACLAAV